MSFRSRLFLFFTIIVIVPMVAVAVVLFSLTADSENGKADARLAEGMRVALAVYGEDRAAARPELERMANDRTLATAIEDGNVARTKSRLTRLVRTVDVQSAEFYGASGVLVARAGSADTTAPSLASLSARGGRSLGVLSVSETRARAYVREVARLTGLDVRLAQEDHIAATTLDEEGLAKQQSGDVEIGGREYRGRSQRLPARVGPVVTIGVFDDASDLSETIAERRLLIGAVLLAFLILSLTTSVFVVRALQGQIEQFLAAARRIGAGDFSTEVPVHGTDEFAGLGSEFNQMSKQLEQKIEEVEGKRRELEAAIRSVGDAFATGLDRTGTVELAVRTAVQACDADAGRLMPLDDRRLERASAGTEHPTLDAALAAAESEAFKSGATGEAAEDGVCATATLLRTRGEGDEQRALGALSIARRGADFDQQERDLLAYLAGQAAISIENADLHESAQHAAVTDELTGLHNARHMNATLEREIERTKRFGGEVGLILFDLDDFKLVNDTFGHPQGDRVLQAVAGVLKDLSREIDEPARFGGEEFAIALPQTDTPGADQLAGRMRKAIEELEVERLGGGPPLKLTASFGVASLPRSANDRDSLVAAADAALYRAKRAGKNRVEVAAPAPAA